jgi:PEP-CTERM/exosortase A-associated glycosyltransferase
MRVLHILDHSIPSYSGYSFRTLAILREQRAMGWETFHLTGPKQLGTGALEETVDGWHFFRAPLAPGLVTGVPGVGEIEMMGELTFRLDQVARRLKPHLLHAHSPVLNAIPALRVGRRLGIPVIYEVRAFWEDAAVDHGTSRPWGLRYRLTRALETYALKRVDAITTICEGLRAEIVARGIPNGKVTVIPNAVDVEQFGARIAPDPALRERLGLRGAHPVLAFIGSFYSYEGLQVLLNAFPEISASLPAARVLLVGGGPQEGALKQLGADLGIADRVVFTGQVRHDEVHAYYDLADILVYPRLSMRLTDMVTPLKPMEAMAHGRLVVASDVGGHRELIRDGETGILFRPSDAADLAKKVRELVDNPERAQRLRASAKSYVETERNWRVSTAPYQAIYAVLLGSKAAFRSNPV